MSNEKKSAVIDQPITKVRILRDCPYGLVGEVAEIPTELITGAEATGMVDSHPSAVKYAESLVKAAPDAATDA